MELEVGFHACMNLLAERVVLVVFLTVLCDVPAVRNCRQLSVIVVTCSCPALCRESCALDKPAALFELPRM